MSIFNKDTNILNIVRLDWGKKVKKDRNFKKLREEYELVADKDKQIISDQTWHDLEVDQLFLEADRTFTFAGSLMLYKQLREIKYDVGTIKKTGRQVDSLINNKGLREKIQVALFRLKKNRLEDILYFFDRDFYFDPKFKIPAYLLLLLLPIVIGMVILQGLSAFSYLLLLFIADIAFYTVFQKYIQINKDYFFTVRNLIIAANQMANIQDDELKEYIERLKVLGKNCKSIVYRSKGLEFVESDTSGITMYLDIFFMISIRNFYKIIHLINKHRKDLTEIFMLIGTVDALVGVASYKSKLKNICKPEFTDDAKILDIAELYNPLLKDSVKNNIHIEQESVYLTGSNMSGKSTFLRSVGLNILMAQTFDFAFCKHYKCSIYELKSSISRNDNLLEGKSYFLKEAEIVLDMLKDSNTDITSLIIIDEIFRGTNTKERIQASIGVLNYLAHQNAVVFVATHDLEIKERINKSYQYYHFGESVGSHGIEFDYKIKEGTAVVGNALKILKFIGYPEGVFE